MVIDYLAIFGVLTLGILHGANDLSLLQSISFMRTKSQRFLVYIATVLLFSLILYHFPMTALLFFVLFSCYHFGEQQWTHRFQSKTNSPQFFYFVYGAFLFSMLFWSHADQTQLIIKELSDLHIPPISFQYMGLHLCLFVSSVFIPSIFGSQNTHCGCFTSIHSFNAFILDDQFDCKFWHLFYHLA